MKSCNEIRNFCGRLTDFTKFFLSLPGVSAETSVVTAYKIEKQVSSHAHRVEETAWLHRAAGFCF